MDVHVLQAVFGWCTVVNGFFFAVAFVVYRFAGDWMYRVHSRWFHISTDAFRLAVYAGFGLYELAIFLFNLAPYLALRIVTRS